MGRRPPTTGIERSFFLRGKTVFDPINARYAQYQKKLARAQRELSGKVKWSRNWYNANRTVQKVHRKVRNLRKDYLHKVSATVSKNHAVVVVENLQIKNMSASAAGTVDEPGKNVAAKAGLNRAILQQGWGESGAS